MNGTAFLDSAQMELLSTYMPWYYMDRPSVLPWLTDAELTVCNTVVTYWFYCSIFHILDISGWKWLEKYRIHPTGEELKNRVSRRQVIVAVLGQQVIQTLLACWWFQEKPSGSEVDHIAEMLKLAPVMARGVALFLGQEGAARLLAARGAIGLYTLYWWAIPVTKFVLGMFVIDTWQYFWHRLMHVNAWMYRSFHSWHHRLAVPYAFGALYNHPVEGFILDTCSAPVAEFLTNMSTREAMLLFMIAMFKTCDDHCGYNFPWDPLQMMSPNNADYHDIHHQAIGIKSNFSQPFFVHWDALLGTRLTRKDIAERRSKQMKTKEQ